MQHHKGQELENEGNMDKQHLLAKELEQHPNALGTTREYPGNLPSLNTYPDLSLVQSLAGMQKIRRHQARVPYLIPKTIRKYCTSLDTARELGVDGKCYSHEVSIDKLGSRKPN